MDWNAALTNFLSPPILFFFVGMLAVFVRSDLEIPQPLPKCLSIYLLMAIGFRGGTELRESRLDSEAVLTLGAAILMAAFVPLYSYFVLRRRLDVPDAAAIAATYGSVSAVTFITAAAFLDRAGIPYGGHMVAAMALMESPAILIAVGLARHATRRAGNGATMWGQVLRDACSNSSVFLILGSLLVGLISGANGHRMLAPFTHELFVGVLCFFLLDMGLIAARRLSDLRATGGFLIAFALVVPLVNAALALLLAHLLDLSAGNALLFTVLCASASYIAVPAAMRLAIPEANPSLSLPLALAVTFPFNILVGIPLYFSMVEWLGR